MRAARERDTRSISGRTALFDEGYRNAPGLGVWGCLSHGRLGGLGDLSSAAARGRSSFGRSVYRFGRRRRQRVDFLSGC